MEPDTERAGVKDPPESIFKEDITAEKIGLLLSDTTPDKSPRSRTRYIILIILCAVVFGVILLDIGVLRPSAPPTHQGETLLDTSLIVSGWWRYEIRGGDTYEIQMNASKPVTLYLCEYIDLKKGAEIGCGGTEQRALVKSSISYHETVEFPAAVGDLLLVVPHEDTNLQLKIARIY